MKNVVFVCLGNCCRSQMAEGFARAYGSDVMIPESAGLAPTASVAAETIETMLDKNIDISHHFPKRFEPNRGSADIVVNMSGMPIPHNVRGDIRTWEIEDPYGRSRAVYQRTCQNIEHHVLQLILELRRVPTA